MTTQKRPGLVWAWAVLLIAGANQLLWNLWHAFALGMPEPLAFALGAGPVLLAIGTSALATRVQGGWVLRVLTYGVMLSAIGLSIWAQYELLMLWTRSQVVAVLFPAVGDLAVLIALHVLIAAPRADRAALPVPGQGPVREPVWDAEPVPVHATVPAAVPPAPLEPVPGQTGGPDRPGTPDRTAPEPVTVPAVRPAADRPGTADLTSVKAGDAAALERLDRAFAGQDPATVSVRQVRKELGAGHARADRLLALWVARTGDADRSGTPVDGADREGGPDGEGEADCTAERVTVLA